jgi:hypothetical protein
LTIYLLIAIGWHGGEELAHLRSTELAQAGGFMLVGFITNFIIGITAYMILRTFTRLRKVDAATVSGYYGSDSAGTFVTCVGVLASAHIMYAAYMPVMLAVMEIPGCLVALFLVSLARRQGMDAHGNMPDEPGYDPRVKPPIMMDIVEDAHHRPTPEQRARKEEANLALEPSDELGNGNGRKKAPIFTPQLLHEVFLNPGLYMLFAGIVIGFVSGYQGYTKDQDKVFLDLFNGLLCLFLLEMGITASRKLRDLRQAGWRFVVYALVAPNIYATMGIMVAHAYSMATHQPFQLGTYVLFSVLCGAASYIAVPAVQRLAIPEASPTLPLAASLGVTFSYNVTIGIPVYIQIAKVVMEKFPVT